MSRTILTLVLTAAGASPVSALVPAGASVSAGSGRAVPETRPEASKPITCEAPEPGWEKDSALANVLFLIAKARADDEDIPHAVCYYEDMAKEHETVFRRTMLYNEKILSQHSSGEVVLTAVAAMDGADESGKEWAANALHLIEKRIFDDYRGSIRCEIQYTRTTAVVNHVFFQVNSAARSPRRSPPCEPTEKWQAKAQEPASSKSPSSGSSLRG